MEKQNIKPILVDTYMALVKNSVGSNVFRNVYAEVGGKKTDLTENGNLSCSIFVSSILVLLKLIKEIHVTVDGTLRDLKDSGWVEINKPKPGCVLVWEEKDFGAGGLHQHIGFYIGKGKAISNNPQYGYPTEHNWEKYDGRGVVLILWNPKLGA